ncbi:hypothetical protein [Archangium sp.]|uniref:hypothetical protein n=1 Tax=Archangium sp. TaxID=1872627 RepID=UPI00286B8994|nr:hypothetical protein [Archangium sp.]
MRKAHGEALELRPGRFLDVGNPEDLQVATADEALQALLRGAGARRVLETLAMRGPLPAE